MGRVVLKVSNVSKKYGHKMVVDNISFDVKEGEIFGFIGPNGAGKSTTIKMITGLTSITSGDITVCDYSIKNNFEKAANNIGAIIEIPDMYKFMSGLDNLKYFACLHPSVTMGRIKEVVEMVGLKNRIKDRVSTYSLGMKQRLGIAQSILHEPKLVILDEPTNGLDATGIADVRAFLKRMAREKGVAVLVSSHILSELELLCDNIAIINNGKIVEFKKVDEIRKGLTLQYSHFIKVDYPNLAGKLIKEKFKINVATCNDKIVFSADDSKIADYIIYLTTNKISIFGAGNLSLTLEDVFMSATKSTVSNTGIK